MDPCAELTLYIVRLSQEALHPFSSMVSWCFVPGARLATWAEARETLTLAPKPVIVAPLIESGSMAMWLLRDLAPAERARWEYELANQQAFFGEKLQHFGFTETDVITLEIPAGEFRLSVAELRRWSTEYGLAIVGLGIIRTPDGRTGRLTVRPPGGGRPLGWIDGAECC